MKELAESVLWALLWLVFFFAGFILAVLTYRGFG